MVWQESSCQLSPGTTCYHVISWIPESQCYFPGDRVDLISQLEQFDGASLPPRRVRAQIENRRYRIIHEDRVTIVPCKQRRKTVYDRALKLFSNRLHDALIVRCDDDRPPRNWCYASAFLDIRCLTTRECLRTWEHFLKGREGDEWGGENVLVFVAVVQLNNHKCCLWLLLRDAVMFKL